MLVGDFMIANIIIVAVVVFWAGFVVLSILKKKRREKKNGIPAGCYSCKAFQSGMCKFHCEERK
mgnify:CR=1 FL=1